jgi:periplasmic protein TonB
MAMRSGPHHFDPRAAFVSLAAHGFAVGAIAVVSAGFGPVLPTVDPARRAYMVVEVPVIAMQETAPPPHAPEEPLPSQHLPPAYAEVPQPRKSIAQATTAKIATPKTPTPKARPNLSPQTHATTQSFPDSSSANPTDESEADAALAGALTDTHAAPTQAAPSMREPEPARDDLSSADATVAQVPVVRTARFRVPPSPPIYPRRAIELDLRGTTILRALVDADGVAAEIVVWTSSGLRLLDDAAIAAARSWKFEPAREGALAVAAWVEVPVRFELK